MKRLTAFFTIFALLVTAAPVQFPAEAAAAPTIRFTQGDPQTATVVQGNSIGFAVNKSSGYEHASPPFQITTSGGENQSADQITINTYEGSVGTTTDAHGAYGIRGHFYAVTAEGMAVETYTDDEGVTRSLVASVTSPTQHAITVSSKISIRCIAAETATSEPVFEIVSGSTPTGVFGQFADGTIVAAGRSANHNAANRYVDIMLQKGSSLVLRIFPKQQHANDRYIKLGTTYNITFDTVYSNSVILVVKTPQENVDEVANAIQGNLSANKFILLKSGDSLDWITQDFNLITKTTNNHTEVHIAWEWKPTNDTHNGVLELTNGKDQLGVKVYKQEDDVSGELVATVTYGSATKVAKVPIVIKGKGRPPFIRLINKKIGQTAEQPIVPSSDPVEYNYDIKRMPSVLDVYDGSVTGYTAPQYPHRMTMELNMGEKNAASDYAIITSAGPTADAVEIYVEENLLPYKYGDKINNPSIASLGKVALTIRAKKPGNTKLTFAFFGKGNGGKIEEFVSITTLDINVRDTTPSPDATLKSLVIKATSNELKDYPINFNFAPGRTQYDINLPFKADEITITPTNNHALANKRIEVKVDDAAAADMTSGLASDPIALPEPNVYGEPQTRVIELKVQAQNPNVSTTYVLNINRQPKSTDSTLDYLELYSADDGSAPNLLPDFAKTKQDYSIEVPYKVKELRINAIPADQIGAEMVITPTPSEKFFFGLFGKEGWIQLNDYEVSDLTEITVQVTSEEGVGKSPVPANLQTTYTIQVRRLPPSDNAALAGLSFTDAKGNPIPFVDEQTFAREDHDYRISIPYSTEKITAHMTLDDINAQKVNLLTPTTGAGGKDITPLANGAIKPESIGVKAADIPEKEFSLRFAVTPESGITTQPYYTVWVTREDPNKDATLESLGVMNQDGVALDTFSFNPETLSYTFEVPYEVEKVRIQPKPRAATSTVTVNGDSITDSRLYRTINLTVKKAVKIDVVVRAEDNETVQTYTLNITRQAPSNETRLKGLTVSGVKEFKPIFVPGQTRYTAKVVDGGKDATITATTMHPGATLKINGKKAVSGQPSERIELLEVQTRVTIEVVAQDGKTKREYRIDFTNENLIDRNANADLQSLKVFDGVISPDFQPSTTTYDVAVREDVSAIELFPIPADRYATMRVYAGRKLIGDDMGNYSQYISDGENNFTVEVTSSDKTTTKTYEINVYRNDEEKAGRLNPITADMINFDGSDVIVVDITKFSVISGEVFDRLRQLPEKTIIFQGNDYALQIKGSDISRMIPHTATYDLGISFTLPQDLEDALVDRIDSFDGNEDLDEVFIYFKHHGELPGPMLFTLSLGSQYKSQRRYWSYYNQERDRIDYYGYVTTNTKGTFSVLMDHFSAFVNTGSPIRGAENKTGSAGGNLAAGRPYKINPYTGEGEVVEK